MEKEGNDGGSLKTQERAGGELCVFTCCYIALNEHARESDSLVTQ